MLTQVPEEEDIERVRGDVTALPLRDNNLDIIVMKQVLDYLEEAAQRKALVEVYRTLRENGQFILSALISPDSQVDEVTNELYTRRETIIGRVPIKKLIPNEELLKTWLQETGFRGIESVYRYDIPLSVEDFRTSFGLDAERTRALSELYGDILARDKQHVFRGGDFQGSPQLIEQGLIVRSAK
ncbi:MAG: methyltransferase domain-containing protein [Candidatus Kerfeldbacteria bacterium]|nr:methyltransferase domain-containing protein [Candidatus Kerfeldbacteria bacterium]